MAFRSGWLTLVWGIGGVPLLTRTAARGQERLACSPRTHRHRWGLHDHVEGALATRSRLPVLVKPVEDPSALAVASFARPAAQQCNNVAEVRRETASALTIANMAVVDFRFLLANFRGR